MEGNLPTEAPRPVGTSVTRETPFLVTPVELKAIRKNVATHSDGRFLLREAGPNYHNRLRSYLAAEFSGRIDNPAAEIPEGEKVDPWAAGRIGFAKSAEEALKMDAKLGSLMWERAERSLGVDALPLIKSILRNGINVPPSKSEHQDLYYRCMGFLNQVIQDVSFRQGSQVRLSQEGERYRADTWNHLEATPDTGIILPDVVMITESSRVMETLPARLERKEKPWEKIRDYMGFKATLSERDRDGLELMTDINPMGLRWVFAPAFQNKV